MRVYWHFFIAFYFVNIFYRFFVSVLLTFFFHYLFRFRFFQAMTSIGNAKVMQKSYIIKIKALTMFRKYQKKLQMNKIAGALLFFHIQCSIANVWNERKKNEKTQQSALFWKLAQSVFSSRPSFSFVIYFCFFTL